MRATFHGLDREAARTSAQTRAAGVGGVLCPTCGHGVSAVYDSRPGSEGRNARRRRCLACGHRYTTVEAVAEALAAEQAEAVNLLLPGWRSLSDADRHAVARHVRALAVIGADP